jgi:outer membrane protein assembly factor BamB
MNDFALPAKPKAVELPQRLFPGRILSGFLIVLLSVVLYLRITHEVNETGWLDQAGANLATYAVAIICSIALWSWFSFRSTYPLMLRRGVMLAGLAGMAFVIGAVRLDGLSGNWVPLGWRWSWQQPRDYAREKPHPGLSDPANAAQQDDKPAPAHPIPATQDDFPQFLGPRRDGYLPDVKLSHDWEAQAPQVLWRQVIGSGWSGFAVVADYALTLEQYGDEEFVTCRDLATGEMRWSHAVAGRHDDPQGGSGPRSTPTIHESKVYALGATGILRCLHLSNGELIWQKNLRQEFGISDAEELRAVMWGRAGSPLIYGDRCIVPAGGKDPVSLVAYDKHTGERQWTAGETQISYASPAVLTLCGKEQIVSVNESNLTGHDPETGKVLWSYDWPGHSNGNASTSQPHLAGDNLVFISKGYDEGSEVFRVSELGGEYGTERVWKERRSLQTKFTNAVLVDGHAYGLSDGILQCVDLASGKKRWAKGRYGHGQLLIAGDVILVQTEQTGELVMVAVDPTKHRELGRFKTLGTQSQAWNNLCLVGEKVLLRNADEAMCVELP